MSVAEAVTNISVCASIVANAERHVGAVARAYYNSTVATVAESRSTIAIDVMQCHHEAYRQERSHMNHQLCFIVEQQPHRSAKYD